MLELFSQFLILGRQKLAGSFKHESIPVRVVSLPTWFIGENLQGTNLGLNCPKHRSCLTVTYTSLQPFKLHHIHWSTHTFLLTKQGECILLKSPGKKNIYICILNQLERLIFADSQKCAADIHRPVNNRVKKFEWQNEGSTVINVVIRGLL